MLPKEIQILISEFNPEHRPKMKNVLEELLKETKIRNYIDTICGNCGDELYSDEREETYILWKKYTFCCKYCRYETEEDIRKSFRRK